MRRQFIGLLFVLPFLLPVTVQGTGPDPTADLEADYKARCNPPAPKDVQECEGLRIGLEALGKANTDAASAQAEADKTSEALNAAKAAAPPPSSSNRLSQPSQEELGVPPYPGATFLNGDRDNEGTQRFHFSTSDPKEKVTAFYMEKAGARLQAGFSGPKQDFLRDDSNSRKGKWAILVRARKDATYIDVERCAE